MTDSRSPRLSQTAPPPLAPGGRTRPWRRHPAALRLALCAGIVLLACLLRAPFLRLSVLDWDESLYFVMAQRWLAGDLPYVTVWDQHPIGLPALIAGLGLFTTDLLLAARVLACVAVAGTACLLFVWGERFQRSRLAGLLAALFYVLELSSINNLPANTEVFTNLLVAGGAAVLLEALRRRRVGLSWPAIAGLLFGCALQIKYTVLPEVALLSCGYLAIGAASDGAPGCGTGRGMRAVAARTGTLLLAGALPTLAALLYFARHAALGPWVAANVQANVAYVALVPTLRDSLHRVGHGLRPFAIAAVVAFAGLARAGLFRTEFFRTGLFRTGFLRAGLVRAGLVRGGSAREGLEHEGLERRKSPPAGWQVWPTDRLPLAWTLLWLLGAAIDVVGPLKFWPHYFLVLAAPLGLLAAWAVAHAPWGRRGDAREKSWRSWRRLVAAALLLAGPATGGALGAASVLRMDDAPRRVAAAVLAQHPKPGELYVYNYQPVLYYLTAVRPPSRFVIPTELSDFSASSGSGGIVELRRILDAHPRLIVVARPGLEVMPESFDAAVDAALAGYDLIERLRDTTAAADVLLYRSRGGALTPAGAADGRDVPASRSAPP